MALVDLMKYEMFAKFRGREETFDFMDGLTSRHDIPSERWKELLDLTDAVYDGVIEVKEIPELLAQAFGLDEAKAAKLARDLVAVQLLPMKDVMPGLAEQIATWGGMTPPANDAPQTFDEYADSLAQRTNVTLTFQHAKRLATLVKSYLDGKKTRDDVMLLLQRPIVVGGLGLTPEQAAAMLQTVDEEKTKIKVDNYVGGSGAHISGGDVVASAIEIVPSHEVAKETPVAAGKKLKVESPDATSNDPVLEVAVAVAVNAAAATLAEKRIAKKAFGDLARMAIRGVRDPYQTRSIIERDYKVDGEPLLLLIEAIMAGMETYHGKERGSANPPPLEAGAGEPRVSAARTLEEERAEQAAKVTPEQLAAVAEASKPEKAHAMLTVGSVVPQAAGEVPIVTDIQATRRLVGPVEELGTMTPVEFRRLSSSADEAARKIEDLLHALEATSYDDRIRGIQAWRKSPMCVLYAQMANEALNNGIAMSEVAARRRNKGDESLSPAELVAVATLNAKIRF